MEPNKKKETAGQILARLSEGETSDWSESARHRRANRAWLRQSQRIALHVLDALDEKGMSQKALAEKMQVQPQYISKLLKGGENLSLETISKLEAALQIRLIDIPAYQSEQTVKQVMSSNMFVMTSVQVHAVTANSPLHNFNFFDSDFSNAAKAN